MADQSSPPGNHSGSDDLLEQFHPAFEFLTNADVDDDDMDFDPETGATNPLIYFDVGVADDDDVDDVDYEVEEDEDDDDDYEDEDEGPIVVGRGSAEDDERILTMGAMIAQQTADQEEDEEDQEEEEEEEEEEDPRQSEGTIPSVPHRSKCLLIMKTGARMLRLLNARGLQALLRSHGLFAGGAYLVRGGGDDDGSTRFQRRQRAARHPPPKVPSENGIALMNSGFYGNSPSYADERRRRKKKLATRIMWRELGIGALGERRRDARLVFQV